MRKRCFAKPARSLGSTRFSNSRHTMVAKSRSSGRISANRYLLRAAIAHTVLTEGPPNCFRAAHRRSTTSVGKKPSPSEPRNSTSSPTRVPSSVSCAGCHLPSSAAPAWVRTPSSACLKRCRFPRCSGERVGICDSTLEEMIDAAMPSTRLKLGRGRVPTYKVSLFLRFRFCGVRDFLGGGFFPGGLLVGREQTFQFGFEIGREAVALLLLQ